MKRAALGLAVAVGLAAAVVALLGGPVEEPLERPPPRAGAGDSRAREDAQAPAVSVVLPEGSLKPIIGDPRPDDVRFCDEPMWQGVSPLLLALRPPGAAVVDEEAWGRHGAAVQAGIASWISKCHLGGVPERSPTRSTGTPPRWHFEIQLAIPDWPEPNCPEPSCRRPDDPEARRSRGDTLTVRGLFPKRGEAMPSPEDMRATVTRYVELLSQGDAQGIIELYAEDARVEDPVGGDPLVGRAAVLDFYTNMSGKLTAEITGPIRVAGRECAFPMLARAELGGNRMEMDVIDVMRFDDAGKVTSMRAFWSPGEMRPAT